MGHGPLNVPGESESEPLIAVIELGFQSDAASLALLGDALGADDPRSRALALGALARRGSLPATAVIDALRDDDPEVRQRAAQLASRASGRGARGALGDALRHALEDPIALCVVEALVAIGARGDLGALDDVRALARSHRDPLVVETAVATLAELGDRRGLPEVLEATTGRPALRRRSVAALGAFDGPEVEAALDRLAEDRDWQVRQAVAMLRRVEFDEPEPDDD